MENNAVKSCYVHIPFCKNICSYCDFCKNFYDQEKIDKYINSLEFEIGKKYKGEILDTLYIGGGTPSCLSINELEKFFNILKQIKLNNNYEYTFECNYEDINEELLELLIKNNVNRISIGIQTFNNKYSKLLGRNINKEDMINKINLCKKYFNNINIDFMYALLNSNIKDLENDLEEFIKLNVNHISTYCLIIEEHTKLSLNNTLEIDDELQSKMYYKIVNKLKQAGYNHYEISNFAKKGYESAHNLTYWNNDRYYGFGMGASGFIENIRYNNTRSLNNYIKKDFVYNYEKIDKQTMIKDEVMLNLRKISGINKNNFKKKYNNDFFNFFNIDFLLKNKLLIEESHNIYIPENKLFISNEIIIKIFDSIR